MTKRNDGKDLEHLVRMVEGINLPPGFTIESNRRVYDENGSQLAELDILVTGKHGTVMTRTLYECRNRPSDGKQDGNWINSLGGKRDGLGYDTAVAVSTTGFSDSALFFAQKNNVRLRSVEALTPDELIGFPGRAPLIHNIADPVSVQIEILPEGEDVALADSAIHDRKHEPVEGSELSIIELATRKMLAVQDFWVAIRDANQLLLFYDVPCTGQPIEKTVTLGYELFEGYRVLRNGKRWQIRNMFVNGQFRRENSKLAMQFAYNYGEDHVVVKWGAGDVEEHGVKQLLMILTKRKGD